MEGLCYGCWGDGRLLAAAGIDDFVEAGTAHCG